MNALAAAVALATFVVGGGSGGALPAAAVTVDPPIAVPPQISRIKIRVKSIEKLFMIVHVHPGTSRCGATVSAEFDRWPDPHGQEILERFTRAGSSLVTAAFHGQPGMYRTCVYFDSDETRNLIVATATFKIRAVNRIMRIGQGLRPWKLGEPYVRRAGYEGRYLDTKPVPACRQSFWEATRVDEYRGSVNVAWVDGVLAGVRTSLRGDRSEDGFVIGAAGLRGVRQRHPEAPVTVETFDVFGNLRKRVVVVSKSTAAGTAEVRYWFDASGILWALETSERRC